MQSQPIITLDLEGVLIPEIWQLIAKKTNVSKLLLTTRDIPDYHELMTIRLQLLKDNNITMSDIQTILAEITPLNGAVEFLTTLRARVEVIILSDTFLEFFAPIRKLLGYPTILCNMLTIDDTERIQSYRLRVENGKYKSVKALQSINCRVAAVGDSYNDVSMLEAADYGAWYNPPESIAKEYTMFPIYHDYTSLADALLSSLL